MPDPDRLLKTLTRSSQAFRNNPDRRGQVVVLQDTDEILAAGDLHGHVENFRRLLLLADLARHPRRHLVLQEVIHGPFRYPTGGDKSHQVIDLTAALSCHFPNRVHFLPGNHEWAQKTGEWIAKGDLDLNEEFRRGIENAYGRRQEMVYSAYMDWIAAAPLAVRTPNRVLLCHSLPPAARLDAFDPEVFNRPALGENEFKPGGAVYPLLWGRDTRGSTAARFLAMMDADWLITGHVPSENGYQVPNDRQLILDCTGAPAACCLFPADRPLTHEELIVSVRIL